MGYDGPMRLLLNIVVASVLGVTALVVYFATRPPAGEVAPAPVAVPVEAGDEDPGIAPLTESQRIRLETATDHRSTVHEAAFYALLENAADWGRTRATDEDVLMANMDTVLAEPDRYRGRLCVIEGTLAAVRPVDTTFDRWQDIRVWFIRLPDGSPDPDKLYTNTLVPVYLTDPLPLRLFETDSGQSTLSRSDYGRPVRVVARFLKVLEDEPIGDPTQTRRYPVFVGKRAHWAEPAKRAGPGLPVFIPLVLMVIVVYVVLRIVLARRSGEGFSRVDLQRRLRSQRLRLAGEDEPEEPEPDVDLPEDPAEALGTLDRQAAEHRNHGDR